MRTPVVLFSAVVGAVFLALAYVFYYQPDFMNDYTLDEILTNSHAKARAAVSRLLFDPASAEFGLLRSVWVGKAKYVCGGVSAKDRSGAYAQYRALVYTVAIDSARIDDDEQIAQKHDTFKKCPSSEEEELAQQKTAISPGALSVLKTMQKAIPAAAPSTLSTMASQASPAGGKSSGATTEHLLGQLAGQVGSQGQQSSSTFEAALDKEGEWRGDRPPAAWPVFPPDHPLSKPVQNRTTAQAIALAAEVEERWAQFKAGNPKERPSPDDIREALGALLAIDPKDPGFRGRGLPSCGCVRSSGTLLHDVIDRLMASPHGLGQSRHFDRGPHFRKAGSQPGPDRAARHLSSGAPSRSLGLAATT